MRNHTNTSTPAHPSASTEIIRPLTALRLVPVPAHLSAVLAASPMVTPSGVFTASRGHLAPDFAALFPRGAMLDAWGDVWEEDVFTAAAAAALYTGVEVTFDMLRLIAGDLDVWGPGLLVTHPESFSAADLYGVLPDPVVAWLEGFSAEEGAAWLAFLLAEVQLHGLRLAAGWWPEPHSTGSEMALHLILDTAIDWLEEAVLDSESPEHDLFRITSSDFGGGVLDAFRRLDGFDTVFASLDALGDLLFQDLDVLMLDEPWTADFAMGCHILHPRNWFEAFRADENPWLAPSATGGSTV